MMENNIISKITKRTLPFLLAFSTYGASLSDAAKSKLELPNKYSVVEDNSTRLPINFPIYYSGEKFDVRMIETEKRGLGKWRPWMIEGKSEGKKYTVGRNNDNLSKFYGMSEQEFYSKLAMTATVAYLDEKSNYDVILRDLAKEFRATASGNIYFNSGKEVFDIAGIAGGILVSKAAFKSNPGAVILAGKTIKKAVLKEFMDRSTLPDDAKGILNSTDNVADFVKKRIIDLNTKKLLLYADDLDRCANILESHDLNPNTREENWNFSDAKEFYNLFSVAQPEGVALNAFLKRMRLNETNLNSLSKRLLKKVFEGFSGVTYEDVIETGKSVKEIFEYTPALKAGIDDLTKITRRNKKEFLLNLESRFDVTPGRSTDANAFLDSNWDEYAEDLPQEIGAPQEVIIDETKEILNSYPPPHFDVENNTGGQVQDESQVNRAQGEPLAKRNVQVYDFYPNAISAGTSGNLTLYISNQNEFAVKNLDITNIEIVPPVITKKYHGFSLERTVTNSTYGMGWEGSGNVLITNPIDVLDPNEQGELKIHYTAAGNSILGGYKILYQLRFSTDSNESQNTKQRELEIEVMDPQ